MYRGGEQKRTQSFGIASLSSGVGWCSPSDMSDSYGPILWVLKSFSKISFFLTEISHPKFSHLTKQQLALFLVSSIGISNEALANLLEPRGPVRFTARQGVGIQRELKRVYGENGSRHTFETKTIGQNERRTSRHFDNQAGSGRQRVYANW